MAAGKTYRIAALIFVAGVWIVFKALDADGGQPDGGLLDGGQLWRGLVVAPEARCSPYVRRRDYRYPQSVENKIIRRLGGVYGPYTKTWFSSAKQTDIEHIVSLSEAHDSGLCAKNRATRMKFARDTINLTLASPRVNRHQKGAHDASGWSPTQNLCWFAGKVVQVKRAYALAVDGREAKALEAVLSKCASTAMVMQ